MNLFITASRLADIASGLSDKHFKLILEATQMLYTALFLLDPDMYAQLEKYCAAQDPPLAKPYKKTHQWHPMTMFAGSGPLAFEFVLEYATALNAEFVRRFDKDRSHKCMDHIELLRRFQPRFWDYPDRQEHAKAKGRKASEGKATRFAPFDWVRAPHECHGQVCRPVERLMIPLCMPEDYMADTAVESYRRYLMSPDKVRINKWARSDPPDWYKPVAVPEDDAGRGTKRKADEETAEQPKKQVRMTKAKERELFQERFRFAHSTALDFISQNFEVGRSHVLEPADLPDHPEVFETIREVRELARGKYKDACKRFGKAWWNRKVESAERYRLVYDLDPAESPVKDSGPGFSHIVITFP